MPYLTYCLLESDGFSETGVWFCSLTSEHANTKQNKMSSNIEIFRLNFISTITGFLEYFQFVSDHAC